MCDMVIMGDDVLEYLTSHICFYDYDKLKMVSVKFNNIFSLKSKNYAEIMNIKGCDIVNVIETRVFNKYISNNPNKNKIINKSLLYDYWYYDQYPAILKSFNRIIKLKCGKCVEYLIALLYNSEYTNHRNVVDIFDNISKYIALYPTNNIIIEVIMVSLKILHIRDNYHYKFKSTYKYIIYHTNINIYMSIMIKALYNSIVTNIGVKHCKINQLFSIANNNLNEYKYSILTDPRFSKIFPKYYIKCILDIIEDSYICLL